MKDNDNQTSILFVVNDKELLRESTQFLSEKGYKFNFARNVLDATAKIAVARPSIVFLSLNLADVTIDKIYSLFTQKLKFETVIFPEQNISQSICQKMMKQYPHFLLPPLTGFSFHSKIQEILFQRFIFEGNNSVEKKGGGIIYVRRNQVPPQNRWEEVAQKQNDKDKRKTWRSYVIGENGEKSIYFYKGKKPPRYNKEKKKWETDPGGLFCIEMDPQPPGQTIKRKDLFARCLEETVSELVPSEINPIYEINFATKMLALLVTSSRYNGYLIMMTDVKAPSPETLLADVFENLQTKMKENGIPLSAVSSQIQLKIKANDLPPEGKLPTGPTVKFQIGDESGAFIFLSLESIPQTIEGPLPELLGISTERYLTSGLPLSFDLYLHLPKNEKLVRYLSKGAVLSSKTLVKLLKFETNYVYIKADEKDRFFSYCLKRKIIKPE